MSEFTDSEIIVENGIGKKIGAAGSNVPIISCNGYTFSPNEIKVFEIDTTDWIPKLDLRIKTSSGVFLSRHFPKDGDLLSVFIRSMTSLFKPIRVDFIILQVDSNFSKDSEGNTQIYDFSGIMNLTNMFSSKNDWIFEDMISAKACLELANKIGLGFVSNDIETNDKMTWRANGTSYISIIDSIRQHAYKDDNSFFDVWIDYYYNMNFINLNKVYSVSDDMKTLEGYYSGIYQADYDTIDGGTQNTKTTMILTNSLESKSSNMFFKSFSIMNNSGFKNSSEGYKKKLYFYDDLLKENVSFETSPFKTAGSEKTKNPMLGRKGENYYKDNIINEWIGFQMSGVPVGNVHSKWRLAQIQNEWNRLECEKITLKLNFENCNFNIFKGMVIPIIFEVVEDNLRVKVSGNMEDQGEKSGASLDRFLSGNYVVRGVNLKWTQNYNDSGQVPITGKWSQIVKVSRREWPMPDTPLDNFSQDPTDWATQYAF
jgi:hypothetical protein